MVQYEARLGASFAALADQTRRGILERLGRGEASITDLADKVALGSAAAAARCRHQSEALRKQRQ